MALIKCPECDLQVSDKALSCPHCGYPLKEAEPKSGRGKAKQKKRRKLPNGFGSIVELKNKNLRKPFWVRVCVGSFLRFFCLAFPRPDFCSASFSGYPQ